MCHNCPPEKRTWMRPPSPGPEEEPLGDDLGIGILLAELLLNAWQNLIDESLLLHIDQKLRIRWIKSLGRIRQEKAQGALPDGRCDVRNSRNVRDVIPHLLGDAVGRIEPSPPREPDIDHELCAGGVRGKSCCAEP